MRFTLKRGLKGHSVWICQNVMKMYKYVCTFIALICDGPHWYVSEMVCVSCWWCWARLLSCKTIDYCCCVYTCWIYIPDLILEHSILLTLLWHVFILHLGNLELYCVWGVQSYFSWAWYIGEERRYNEVEKAYNREYMLKAT